VIHCAGRYQLEKFFLRWISLLDIAHYSK